MIIELGFEPQVTPWEVSHHVMSNWFRVHTLLLHTAKAMKSSIHSRTFPSGVLIITSPYNFVRRNLPHSGDSAKFLRGLRKKSLPSTILLGKKNGMEPLCSLTMPDWCLEWTREWKRGKGRCIGPTRILPKILSFLPSTPLLLQGLFSSSLPPSSLYTSSIASQKSGLLSLSCIISPCEPRFWIDGISGTGTQPFFLSAGLDANSH